LAALFICSSVSTISTQALAATVNISDNLIVSEVNDRKIEKGLLENDYSLELTKGTHALVVRYKDVFEDLDFAEERVVESQEFIVKFTIADQDKLKLSTTKIKNLAAADRFVKSPELQLTDARNNQIELSLAKVSDYKLARQVDKVVNAIAINRSVSTQSSAHTNIDVRTQHSQNSTQVNALTMLNYWWQNASAEEKQLFKQITKAK
jgi:uncharacterized protein YccT (UPF0319 family)